ncbi:MAG: hypothetical protein PHZ09_14885, partial [Eubacteriales bacterium]|nr:hypothetical protein [Eubacteriales bacterium]
AETPERYNRHASAVAYDDDADGRWDRIFYTYQEFCKLSYDPASHKYNLNGGQYTVSGFTDGKTGEITAAPAGFVRYSYNPLSRRLELHETYIFKTGLVTAINTAVPDIVIGGTRYTVGTGNFPGAEYDSAGAGIGLIGKQVNYVLSGNAVIRIFDSATAEVYAVFDSLTGLTSSGYATGLVYIQSGTPSVITIATINGLSYQTFARSGGGDGANALTKGMLFTGTKDALGFWHLQTVSLPEPAAAAESSVSALSAESACNITFKNNIAHTPGGINQFNTNRDTLFIVYNRDTGTIETAKGIPADDSAIRVRGKIHVAYSATGNGPTAQFVYVGEGAFENFTTVSREYRYDTVIYVDRNSKATAIPGEYESWQYSRVLDMINGRFITVNTTYDRQLKAGGFYTVKNGYVSGQAVVGGDSEIRQGRLIDAGMFFSTVIDATREKTITDSAYIYLYYIKDGNVAVSDVTGTPLTPESYGDGAFWYDGYQKGSRVILCVF